jgi:hypothetical protein
MLKPTIIYDESLLAVVPSGKLSNGDVLTSTPESLTFTFGCTSFKQSRNDLEINLNFQNNEMINLYLIKECDTMSDVQDYFNFFYTIYYILLLIFFGFVITILYYYFRRNDISLLDLYNIVRNKALNIYRSLTNRMDKVLLDIILDARK